MTNTNQQEQPELKPCPFCGGEAVIEQNSRNGYKLKCKSCVIQYKQKTLRNSMEWLKNKMIENWNTRLEPYTPPVEDGKLGGEVEKYEDIDDWMEDKMYEIIDHLDTDSNGLIIGRIDAARQCTQIAKNYAAKLKSQPSTPVQDGWVSIKDSPPPLNKDFLVLFDTGEIMRYFEEDHPYSLYTHWQPLPSPPVNKQD